LPRLLPRLARLSCVLLLLTAGFKAWADPPSRVGRVSLIEGALSLRHADETQWSPAGLNFPVIAGDEVWTDQASRGELQIGGAEARIDGASLLSVLRLDEEATALRLDQGVLNLTVRFLPPGGLQIVSAIGQLDIRQPGEYHVDAGRPGGPPTQLVMGVLVGEARFSGPRGIVELHSGQGVMVPPDQSQLSMVSLYPTPFDQWAEARAQTLQAAQSVRYVSTEVTGYQDLDHYGRWEEIPDYGPVWFPTAVETGWAPYRYGHWAFIRPWGWTWIDDAPWGFAPFHYGRWLLFEGRWAWIPGERRERPCYAPALVAFIGGGPGAGVGVGWVPLGPREAFHPYYPVSEGYLRAVNRPHVANVTQITVTNVTVNTYVNRGAATSVPTAAFTGGQPVRQNLGPQPSFQGRQQQPIMTNLNHLQPTAPAAPAPAPAPAMPVPRQGPPAPQPAPAAPAAPAPSAIQPRPAAPPQAVPPQAPAAPPHPVPPAAPAVPQPAMPAPMAHPVPMPAPAQPQPQFVPPHPAPTPMPAPQAQPAMPHPSPQQPAPQQPRPRPDHDHEREH
jgi:hypothetical protein